MPNTIPVQVGGEWRSPAESVGYCRFQIALSGSLSANLVQTAGRSGSEASVGLTRSGLNTAQGRSRGGLVSEITIKQDLYAGCFVQVQSAVQTFRGEIEAEDTRTFRQRILSIFSVSLGVPVGRFSTFQLMSPSLEDLAQAFFLRVSLTVDANQFYRTIRRSPALRVGEVDTITGNMIIQIRVGLTAQGAIAIGARLLRHLPGFIAEPIAAAVVDVGGTAALSTVTVSEGAALRLAGGVPGVAITLGFTSMDLLNLALAGVRAEGERRGRLQRVARGYLSRVYFDESPEQWQNPDRNFQRGVRMAERDIQQHPNGSAGLLATVDSVTHINSSRLVQFDEATQTTRQRAGSWQLMSDAVFRLGEYWYQCIREHVPPDTTSERF